MEQNLLKENFYRVATIEDTKKFCKHIFSLNDEEILKLSLYAIDQLFLHGLFRDYRSSVSKIVQKKVFFLSSRIGKQMDKNHEYLNTGKPISQYNKLKLSFSIAQILAHVRWTLSDLEDYSEEYQTFIVDLNKEFESSKRKEVILNSVNSVYSLRRY